MISQTDIHEEIRALQARLNGVSRDILLRFPMEDYRHDCLAHTTHWRRSLYSKKRERIFQLLGDTHGTSALALYHKLGLCRFMAESLDRIHRLGLPDSVDALLKDWYRQILKDCKRRSDSYYQHLLPSFVTDLKMSILRSFPVGGPWTVDLERISLKAFRYGSPWQKWRFIKCLALEARGVVPYLVVHTAPSRLCGFNEEEMNRAYLRMAELMKRWPSVRGIYRRSWFLDPRLDTISPELSYLRTVPQENGARLFVIDKTQADIDNALRLSIPRRRMYARGEYRPQGFAYIWPRRAVLEWATYQATTNPEKEQPCEAKG
jgi:hypothetical protein